MKHKTSKELVNKILDVLEPHLDPNKITQETILSCLEALVVCTATLGATTVVATTDTIEERKIRSERFAELFKNDLAKMTKTLAIAEAEDVKNTTDKKDIIWH